MAAEGGRGGDDDGARGRGGRLRGGVAGGRLGLPGGPPPRGHGGGRGGGHPSGSTRLPRLRCWPPRAVRSVFSPRVGRQTRFGGCLLWALAQRSDVGRCGGALPYSVPVSVPVHSSCPKCFESPRVPFQPKPTQLHHHEVSGSPFPLSVRSNALDRLGSTRDVATLYVSPSIWTRTRASPTSRVVLRHRVASAPATAAALPCRCCCLGASLVDPQGLPFALYPSGAVVPVQAPRGGSHGTYVVTPLSLFRAHLPVLARFDALYFSCSLISSSLVHLPHCLVR